MDRKVVEYMRFGGREDKEMTNDRRVPIQLDREQWTINTTRVRIVCAVEWVEAAM